MHAAELVTPPAEVAVSLARLKGHARVLHDGEDTDLQGYLDAAIQSMDGPRGLLGRCLVTQTWRQDYDGWADMFRLPVPDVASVEVTYIDAAGSTQTVATDQYQLENRVEAAVVRLLDGFTRPALGVESKSVSITLTAGFGGADEIPAPLVSAILILARHLSADREGRMDMPPTAAALIAPYRRGLV